MYRVALLQPLLQYPRYLHRCKKVENNSPLHWQVPRWWFDCTINPVLGWHSPVEKPCSLLTQRAGCASTHTVNANLKKKVDGRVCPCKLYPGGRSYVTSQLIKPEESTKANINFYHMLWLNGQKCNHINRPDSDHINIAGIFQECTTLILCILQLWPWHANMYPQIHPKNQCKGKDLVYCMWRIIFSKLLDPQWS